MSSWKLVNVFFVEHSIWPLVFPYLLLKLLLLLLLLKVRDFKKNRDDDDVSDFDAPLVVIVVLFSKVY